MSLTKGDLKAIKLVVSETVDKNLAKRFKIEFDERFGKRFETLSMMVNNAVDKNLTERFGKNLEIFDELIGLKIDEKIEEKGLVTKEDIKHLPTKEEFYNQTDKILKELKDMREEHVMLSHRVYENHEPRIEKIETKLGITPL